MIRNPFILEVSLGSPLVLIQNSTIIANPHVLGSLIEHDVELSERLLVFLCGSQQIAKSPPHPWFVRVVRRSLAIILSEPQAH